MAADSKPNVPIIDTHIHLFDPTRKEGIPWPPKTNEKLYKPSLPDRYRKLTASLGVVGAIKVEASPWLEDNQWVLNLIANEPLIVGFIGNLDVGKPDFKKNFDRFHKNPLFLGIRNGNLWDRNFRINITSPEFLADLKTLAAAGLTMDTANPNPALVEDLLHLTDKVPELRLVIDHLPQLTPPSAGSELKAYEANLEKFRKRKQVYVKISSVLRKVGDRVPTDLAFYKPRLDQLFDVFGEDRVVFGSDWPNSDNWAEYPAVLKIVTEYFATKPLAIQEKYFWKNSVAAYRWKKRSATQPSL